MYEYVSENYEYVSKNLDKYKLFGSVLSIAFRKKKINFKI